MSRQVVGEGCNFHLITEVTQRSVRLTINSTAAKGLIMQSLKGLARLKFHSRVLQ